MAVLFLFICTTEIDGWPSNSGHFQIDRAWPVSCFPNKHAKRADISPSHAAAKWESLRFDGFANYGVFPDVFSVLLAHVDSFWFISGLVLTSTNGSRTLERRCTGWPPRHPSRLSCRSWPFQAFSLVSAPPQHDQTRWWHLLHL